MSIADQTAPARAWTGHQEKIWSYFQNAGQHSFDPAEPRLNFLINQIAKTAKAGPPALLNIGVGSGHLERMAHQRGWRVHSLDPDAQAIERLKKSGIQAQVGYIQNIPLQAATMQYVVTSEVLEHLSHDVRSAGIQEIARVLKPGGWFLGTVPYNEDLSASDVVCPGCGELFHRWGHQKSFQFQTIRDELSHWFEIRDLRRTAFVPFRGRSLFGKLKSLARLGLARSGQTLAVPSIYWAAIRTTQPI